MKVLALSFLLVLGVSAVVPAFADTTFYDSKANSTWIEHRSTGSSESVAFDVRAQNSKLGSSPTGTSSVDVMTSTFRDECTKCSS